MMKNKLLYILLLSIIVTSCNTLPKPQTFIKIIDYSLLTKEGIYVTESNSVNFDYIAVGSIIVTEKGGWEFEKRIDPNIESALKKLVIELKKINANGIINLTVSYSSELASFSTSQVYVPTITVRGMAIKTSENKLTDIPIIKTSPQKEKDNYLGKVDDVECWIIKKYTNGVRIRTSKKLSVEQIRKAKDVFLLKGQIMFYLKGDEEKKQSYAGIDDKHIILYDRNDFIEL